MENKKPKFNLKDKETQRFVKSVKPLSKEDFCDCVEQGDGKIIGVCIRCGGYIREGSNVRKIKQKQGGRHSLND